MTAQEKTQLDNYLASLDRAERAKLLKRAAQLKKATVRAPVRRPTDSASVRDLLGRHASEPAHDVDLQEDQWGEEEEEFVHPTPKPRQSLDDFLWRLVQLDSVPVPERTDPTGLVIEVGRRSCSVLVDGEVIDCPLSKELAATQQSGLAVGDQAYLNGATVVGAATRRTKLSRPDVDKLHTERVIAANIDTVVVVVSVISPPLHPRVIDRYLIAIQRGGCRAVLAVNKLDLLDSASQEVELQKLACYEALGVPVVRCSAWQRRGMDELRRELSGQLAAFVGHSGVGKSSLINSLKPELALKVGEVSQGNRRGAHTTTSSTLLDLGEMRLIDTPGIRSFGLWALREEDLPWYFPEFAAAGSCKFRDCTHTHEPECAVKDAIDDGIVARERYETYLRIRAAL
jgi:ribosome biogenesis GTPase